MVGISSLLLLLLIIIPLCGYNTICFSVFMLMDIWVVSSCPTLLEIALLVSLHRNVQPLYSAILRPWQLKLFLHCFEEGG